MIISRKMHLHMGHRIPNHKSKCFSPHGHCYHFEVSIDDKVNNKEGESDEGMVYDYGDLDKLMREHIYNKFDHSFMICDYDILYREWGKIDAMKDMKINAVKFIPTAENIARYWYEIMRDELRKANLNIYSVTVRETPNSCAIYDKQQEERDNAYVERSN